MKAYRAIIYSTTESKPDEGQRVLFTYRQNKWDVATFERQFFNGHASCWWLRDGPCYWMAMPEVEGEAING